MTANQPRKQSDWHLPVAETDEVPRPKMKKTPDAVAERKRMALGLAAQGFNKTQIAKAMSIDRDTVKEWVRVDPTFREMWDRAVESRDDLIAEEMEEVIVGLARGTLNKDGIPHFSAAKHMAAVTNPNRHGDKKQVTHSGTVVHTLIPTARRLDDLPFAPDDDVIEVAQIERGDDND